MQMSIEARLLLRSDFDSDVPAVVPCRIVGVSESGAKFSYTFVIACHLASFS